ncbi:hypothetical protein PMX70_02185 [Collinsella aerofaciens]|uniref:hypothetical protein n=1 Tax=Collinsella aerofaciens TaxID=74426 RepID=UPI00232B6276|nr:hypothetical protein [Collinsella aerofaciens]MDB1905904.1 hypothetical protein [Collinsella aerofaciens]
MVYIDDLNRHVNCNGETSASVTLRFDKNTAKAIYYCNSCHAIKKAIVEALQRDIISRTFPDVSSPKYLGSFCWASTPKIERVIFHGPATIVYWEDGTKTVVKAHNEKFDKEKGLLAAIAKKVYGNKGNFNNIIKHFVEE